MGYATNITGEITIHPPLAWKDIRNSVFLPENVRGGSGKPGRNVVLCVEKVNVETDEGTLSRKQAVAVRATHAGYQGYAGNLAEHLQELVDAFPEHKFHGRIEGFGEDRDDPDLWRIKVIDHQVVEFKPTILWDEESE